MEYICNLFQNEEDYETLHLVIQFYPNLFLKLLFYTRDKKYGKKNKELFYKYFFFCYEKRPDILLPYLKYISNYGTCKDLIYLFDHVNRSFQDEIVRVLSDQIVGDYKYDRNSNSVKYLPQERKNKHLLESVAKSVLQTLSINYKHSCETFRKVVKKRIQSNLLLEPKLFTELHQIIEFIYEKNVINIVDLTKCENCWKELGQVTQNDHHYKLEECLPCIALCDMIDDIDLNFIYYSIALSIYICDKRKKYEVYISDEIVNLSGMNLFEKVHFLRDNIQRKSFFFNVSFPHVDDTKYNFIFTNIPFQLERLNDEINVLNPEKKKKYIIWNSYYNQNKSYENIYIFFGMYNFYNRQILKNVYPHRKSMQDIISLKILSPRYNSLD
jgi:hypothetical protein